MTDQALIEAHIAAINADEISIAKKFYERLFAAHPSVEPLFSRNKPEAQQKMMNDALGLVVMHADDLSAIDGELLGLGKQHQDYGEILPAHYDAVIAVLVETLSELAPAAWSPKLESIWTDLLGQVTAKMREGHFSS